MPSARPGPGSEGSRGLEDFQGHFGTKSVKLTRDRVVVLQRRPGNEGWVLLDVLDQNGAFYGETASGHGTFLLQINKSAGARFSGAASLRTSHSSAE